MYSPVLDFASTIGKKPETVTSVPVSIGNAVLVYAKAAARVRVQPCASFTAIISTEMMASSTSRPSASTSVPSETLCRPMPKRYITSEVTASTMGIVMTTTMPVRTPSETRLTSSTMPTASATASTKSSTECETALGMLDTSTSLRPSGSWARSCATRASSALPSRTTSPPGCIVRPMPSTALPSKRICVAGGSS